MMEDESYQLSLLHGGDFSLDPGAAFGIVPTPVWSKRIKPNENGRIDMTTNTLLIRGPRWTGMFDSGLSDSLDERLKKFFEVKAPDSFWQNIRDLTGDRGVDYFFQTHLHFDHVGHAVEYINSGKYARIVAQRDEIYAWKRPNVLSKNSYIKFPRRRNIFISASGNTRINSRITLVKTGGHTQGHQALIYKGKIEIIYFGDIVPTSFHLKLPYVTAIDLFPLETVDMKRKLIRKAIRDHAIVIFDHDREIPAARLSGEVEKPVIEPFDF